MRPRAILVGVNEDGRRVGQYHHRTKVPDAVINQIRELREERNLSFGKIASIVGLPRRYVAKVAKYEIRAQIPVDWVQVVIHETIKER